MGLLDFFSRKAGNKGKTSVALKSPACNSAAARSLSTPVGDPKPPRRPYYVGTLQGGRPEFTQSQLSFDTASEDERSAPAPRVPVSRDERVERPSTAPGTRSSSTLFPDCCDLRPKTDGRRRPPPLSLRVARPETPAAESRAGSRSSIATPANVFRRGSEQSGAASLRSGGGKAFKDILDAQSEIRPADFKERVRAAGTRDYGEDVAERNLSQNGLNIATDHVRALHAPSQAISLERTDSPLANNRPGLRLGTEQAGIGIEPLRSCSQQNVAGHVSPDISLLSSPKSGRREGSEERRSFSTFIHLSSDHSWKSPSALRLPEIAPAPAVRTARLPRDSVEVAKRRANASVTEYAIGYGSPMKGAALHSTTRSRRSSTIASAASAARKHHSLYTLRSSVSSSVLSQDTMIHPTPLSYPRGATPQRQAAQGRAGDSTANLHSIPSEISDGILTDPPSVTAMFGRTEPTDLTFGNDEAIPPLSSHSFPLRSNNGDSCDTNIDLLDGTMGRTASIRTRKNRPWSASSDAPTATDSFVTAVSHPFHSPPPSLGTADTLVDLDASVGASPRPKTPASMNHGDMIYVYSNSESHLEHGKGQGRGKRLEAVDTFNIDDYLSTDSEPDSVSTTPNRRPTAEGEEDLLFNDAGYGASGMQLPGLPDPFPVSPSFFSADDAQEGGVIKDGGDDKSSLLYMARLYGLEAGYWDYGIGVRSDESLVGIREDRLVDEESERRRRTRRFVLDTAADDEESGSGPEWDLGWRGRKRGVGLGLGRQVDDGDGYDADCIDDRGEEEQVKGAQRPSPQQRMRKRTRRLSALYRVDDDQEAEAQNQISQTRQQQADRSEQQQSDTAAEPEDKVDIADAARLRKKMMSARRLAGLPSSARIRRQARMSMPELRLDGNV